MLYETIMGGLAEAPPDRRAERLPPWKDGIPGRIIEAETRKTDTPDFQRRAALAALRTAGEQDYMLYTDGSARGGVEDGGAGVAVYRGDVLVHSWSGSAGALCSSYTAEGRAMRKAVEWLEGREGWSRALIAMDSKALVAALDGRGGGPSAGLIRDVLWRLSENGRVVNLVWVPGHCDLRGNEEADRLAGDGGGMGQLEVPLEGATRRAFIRREVRGEEIRHPRLVQVYRGGIREGEEESLTRRERELTSPDSALATTQPWEDGWPWWGERSPRSADCAARGRRALSISGWGATRSRSWGDGTSSDLRWPSWLSNLRRHRRCWEQSSVASGDFNNNNNSCSSEFFQACLSYRQGCPWLPYTYVRALNVQCLVRISPKVKYEISPVFPFPATNSKQSIK